MDNTTIDFGKIDIEMATFILSARSHSLLKKSLELLVDIKASINNDDKKELMRVTLIEIQEELIKTLDKLPKRS